MTDDPIEIDRGDDVLEVKAEGELTVHVPIDRGDDIQGAIEDIVEQADGLVWADVDIKDVYEFTH